MSTQGIPLDQFAAKIRSTYPGSYDHLSDSDLISKVVTKYPEYKDKLASYSPTQFEKERTPEGSALERGVKAFGSDVLGAAQGALQAIPGMKTVGALAHGDVPGAAMSLIPGSDVGEKVSQLQGMKEADTKRKAEGYSPLYRGSAAVGQASGLVDPSGMEESAKHGDTAGVVGHTVLPLIGAAAGADQALTGGKGMRAIGEVSAKPALRAIGNPYGLASTGEELLTQGVSPRASATDWKANLSKAAPEIKRYDTETPIKNVQDLNEAIPEIKDRVWKERVEPALTRQAKTPVDMKPVAASVREQITPEMKEFDAGNAEQLSSMADKLENARDIESANRLLKYVNGKLDSYFAKYPSARRSNLMGNPETAGWEAARRSLREQFLGTLENSGEEGVREARQTYGALEGMSKEVERRVNVADRAKPMSLNRILGLMGAPVTGGLSIAAGELGHYLNKPDVLVRRGIRNLPEPSPVLERIPSAGPVTAVGSREVASQAPAPANGFRAGTSMPGANGGGLQHVGVKPVTGYKLSEKAELMGGPRKTLGPEFEEGELAHERERNESILRNPKATPEDRRIAQLRLHEMSEPSLVTEEVKSSPRAAQRNARDRAARIREARQ
jgi:hypothetical protein